MSPPTTRPETPAERGEFAGCASSWRKGIPRYHRPFFKAWNNALCCSFTSICVCVQHVILLELLLLSNAQQRKGSNCSSSTMSRPLSSTPAHTYIRFDYRVEESKRVKSSKEVKAAFKNIQPRGSTDMAKVSSILRPTLPYTRLRAGARFILFSTGYWQATKPAGYN
jgi:hypothetical protein